jgi:hypothetical protein
MSVSCELGLWRSNRGPGEDCRAVRAPRNWKVPMPNLVSLGKRGNKGGSFSVGFDVTHLDARSDAV